MRVEERNVQSDVTSVFKQAPHAKQSDSHVCVSIYVCECIEQVPKGTVAKGDLDSSYHKVVILFKNAITR